MKILIITEYFPDSENAELTGGVESRSYYIAKNLTKNNEITIICSWQMGQKREHGVGKINVIRVGQHHEYSNSGSFISRLMFARAAIKKGKQMKNIDLVDGLNFISYLPAYRIAKSLGVPAVATYHETWIDSWVKNKGIITGTFGKVWEEIVLKCKWDKIISVSKFTKNRLIKFGVDKNKIEVVHNGISPEVYKKIKTKKFKRPTICCIARLTPQKRVEDLIRAIEIVKLSFPNINCKIIGIGDEKGNLCNLANKLRLTKNIDFVGQIKNYEDVIKTLKSSQIFCLPSILEGFGIVVVEAMASGVPYVCSDIAPIKEVTENGKGGLLFKQKDIQDLAEKILLLFNNQRLYDKKKEEGLELVKNYEWDNLAKEVEMVYGGLQ